MGMSAFRFKPLYHGDGIHVINPYGDIGIVTLWSPVDQGINKLREIDPLFVDPTRSRIAVMANLYGDGMFAMFCNLLYNPQIRHLVAMGQDLGLPVCHEIETFLREGLERCQVLGKEMIRIVGTDRYFPVTESFDDDVLRRNLSFHQFGKFSTPGFKDSVRGLLESPSSLTKETSRISVEIPQIEQSDYEYLPSDVIGHQVLRRSPIQCWEELVVRVMRFGRPVNLQKGLRLELQNVKAVIAEPVEEPAEALAKYGFQLPQFHAYQKKVLDPDLPESIAYTYGNRLRGYFREGMEHRDTLQTVIDRLTQDPETRHAYVSLWDTANDLTSPEVGADSAVPCLTTLFFRQSQGALHLTATYRSHNLLTAWLENVYGLMAIQCYVADAISMPTGPITVISQSLGINPESSRFSYAEAIRTSWKTDDDAQDGKYTLREDPHGYFVVTADTESGRLIAEHKHGGVIIKRYEGKRAEEVEKEVSKDMAISLVSHAMWFGRELARKERELNAKKEKR